MGGSESLFDGVSGLSEHQTWMNVIGNNIANVNTSGFKADLFNFEDQLSQELQGAQAPVNGGIGGTDFQQVGLGTHVGSILANQQQGSLQTTNLPTDFAIQGDGFFIVNNGQANEYTRDSNFIVDGFGNINQAATGFHLQGFGLKQVGNSVSIDNTKVVNLTVPQQINPAVQTNLLDLIGNLQSSATSPQTQSIGVFDSLGQMHNVVLTFTPSGKADGNWSVSATAADLTPGSTIQVSGGNAVSTNAGSAALHFNPLGQLDGTITPLALTFIAGSTPTITSPPAGGPPVLVNSPEGPTQAPQPWLIPGTIVPSNAAQSAVLLNINDPLVGNLTQFASPTVTSTQAVPNAATIPNPSNSTVDVSGNLSTISASTNTTMGLVTFVAQDSVGATHTFQLGMTSAGGATNSINVFTPQLLTVDGFSGVAGGNLAQGATATQTTAIFQAVDSTGQSHEYTVQFTPNSGPPGVTDGTVYGMEVTQVDGANPLVVGNLDGSAPLNTLTTYSFSRVEPDGANHQYRVTLSSNGDGTFTATGATIDGGAPPPGTTLTATGTVGVGAAGNTLDINLTATASPNTLDLANGAVEDVTFDFSHVTSNPGTTSLNQEVTNPGAALRYDPAGSGKLIAGGTMSIGTSVGSLFASASGIQENNAAEAFNFDLAQVTNDGAAGIVIGQPANPTLASGTIDVTTLPATLVNPPSITFAAGVPNGLNTVQLEIEGPPNFANSAFGNNNGEQSFTIDFSHVTNNSNPSGLIGPLAGSSGNSAGSLKDFNVDQLGVLHGVYTNGFTQVIGQVLLATFENPGGLERQGQNNLQISADSGVVNIGTPGTGKFGTIAEGNIETSNVDLAEEFSNMILAERGFQANSRIITTSDTMLEQLVNLKQSA